MRFRDSKIDFLGFSRENWIRFVKNAFLLWVDGQSAKAEAGMEIPIF